MIKSKNLKPHESKAQSQITGLFGKGNTEKYRQLQREHQNAERKAQR